MRSFDYSGEEIRLSRLIAKTYPDLSYNRIQKLLRERGVKVDGVRTSKDGLIRGSVHIEIYVAETDFNAVYEDDNIIIIDKPRGVPSTGKISVESHFSKQGYFLCHRLDTNTRGLLVLAKNTKTEKLIEKSLRERNIEKYYRALVYGTLNGAEKLTAYAVKDSAGGYLKVYGEPVPGSVEIKTAYKVIGYEGDNTLLEVQLITGRTHQIRAHLAFIGHFVLGDNKYGDEEINKKLGFSKQQLTADRIIFHFDKKSHLFYLDGKEIKL